MPRPDLDAAAVVKRWHAETGTTPAAPSAEIAADPARLALWETERAQALERLADGDPFEVSGCGQHELYVCEHPRVRGTLYAGMVTCTRNPWASAQPAAQVAIPVAAPSSSAAPGPALAQ